MFADIVGYTKMMQENEEMAKSLRDRKREVLEKLLPRYHGHVMQYYGDGALIMFGSALQAAKCARDFQKEMAKEPAVPVRIGIHTGDIVYDDQGIYGDAVNVASRIQSLGVPGAVMISENVYNEVKNHDMMVAESFGEHSLKNIDKPVHIYSLIYEEEHREPIETVREGEETSDDNAPESLGSRKRGISDMFRTSYRNHIELSAIADNKSNIMISINGIAISIMIASVSSQLDTTSWLLLPAAVLMVTCLLSMVYAVLAARPRVSNHKVTLEHVRSDRSNILFFGNFQNMDQDDYVTGMEELMADSDRLYKTMARDLHTLGKVLSKKFALLRRAYNIFMTGLILSVLSFLIVYFIY